MSESSDQPFHATADVGAQRVARIYAEALLNASAKQGDPDGPVEELDSLVRDVFPAGPNFEAFLASAAVGRRRKEEVLRQAFEGRASPLFFNFLLVLNRQDRLDLLRPMLAAVQKLRDQRA